MHTHFLDHALQYAGRGWRVFPIRPGGKTPMQRGGFHNATVKPSQIEQWWGKWPLANIGIATGSASGLLVIDIDGPDALRVFKSLHDERSNGEVMGASLVSVTARGWHLLFQLVPGEQYPCTVSKGSEKGIDIRADGGYIVAPPSIHPSGHVYRWDLSLLDGTNPPPLFALV
jgi:hypothetical protein